MHHVRGEENPEGRTKDEDRYMRCFAQILWGFWGPERPELCMSGIESRKFPDVARPTLRGRSSSPQQHKTLLLEKS